MAELLADLIAQLTAEFGRPPTLAEVYTGGFRLRPS